MMMGQLKKMMKRKKKNNLIFIFIFMNFVIDF